MCWACIRNRFGIIQSLVKSTPAISRQLEIVEGGILGHLSCGPDLLVTHMPHEIAGMHLVTMFVLVSYGICRAYRSGSVCTAKCL